MKKEKKEEIFVFIFILYIVCVCVCKRVCTLHGEYVEVRGQLVRISVFSFFILGILGIKLRSIGLVAGAFTYGALPAVWPERC